MQNLSFNWQIDEYMINCRSRQLRPRTMNSYEQSLRLFERWCKEQLGIETVDKVTESVIRRYIADLQQRGNPFFSCEYKVWSYCFSNIKHCKFWRNSKKLKQYPV